MNNNRGNNRRRGRNNNNRPQGGGQQLNRIDSRARGNAPQLLEKYRKLAQDAHLNGDRVTAEYYLQFADHYFRVIADTRQRQDEARLRRDDRWQEGGEGFREEGEDGEFVVESDFPTFDQPVYQRREREDRGDSRDGGRDGNQREGARDSRDRDWQGRRNERQPASESDAEGTGAEGDTASASNPYEPPENPFLQPNRAARGLRARRDDGRNNRDRRPDREERAEAAPAPRAQEPRVQDERAPDQRAPEAVAEPAGLDPSLLPPAISRDASEEAEAPAPRRRTRRKPRADEVGDTVRPED